MPDQFNVQVGAVFAGDFRVVRSLNAGGMGAVYVAEQISTGKQRALKVMLPQLVADASLRKRFEQEARIASLIESEHVVEVVGAGVDAASGLPWLAMELLQGEDLGRVVVQRGALPVADVLAIFEQLSHAVGAAHRVGVVHRDLKPENVFLAQAKRAGATFMVKVLDFGIAKIVAEASTKQTAAMGSPIWMAPEQADQSPVTPATDVWALGLIAFFLLTGRPFWRTANDDNATIPQILKEVLFEPIVPASLRAGELGRPLPAGFDAWFARCLARDTAMRFPDAAQAGAALSMALAGAEGPIGSLSSPFVPSVRSGSVPPSSFGTSSPATERTGVAGSYTVGAPPPSFQGQSTVPPAKKVPPVVAVLVVMAALVIGSVVALGAWWAMRPTTAAVAPPTVSSSEPSPDAGIVLDASVDDASRASARDQAALIDVPSSIGADAGNAKPSRSHTTTQTVSPAARSPSTPAAQPVAVVPAQVQPYAPPPPPPQPAPPPQRTAYDLANSAVSADWWTARAMLEPKVTSGTATVEEIRLLNQICKNQRDGRCLKACKKALSMSGR